MTTEHFKGQFEVELKYRIASPQAFKRALNDVPHQIRFEDNSETDWYYDTANHSLRKESKHLLLRDIQPANIQLWIVKGPGGDDCEASDILDLGAAKNMLSTLGYQLTLTMSKTRSIYFVGEYHITFDYLEGLGYFAEFAIMTDEEPALEYHRQQLVSLADKFSLGNNELEHSSYRTLFESLNE